MRPSHTLAHSALLATLLAGCGPQPGGVSLARRSPAITDGQVTEDPPVAALVIGPDDNLQLCTATLVGSRTVLTAAHCILPDLRYRIFIGGRERPLAAMTRHPTYQEGDPTYAHDLGLISLADAVTDVEPVQLGLLLEPRQGMPVTLVGYGATAAGQSPTGELRSTTNAVGGVDPSAFWVNGTGNGVGNICSSDSGGPAFTEVDAGGAIRRVQIGVASMGTTPCGLLGRFARLDAYGDWIVQAAGGDLPAPDAPPRGEVLDASIADAEPPTLPPSPEPDPEPEPPALPAPGQGSGGCAATGAPSGPRDGRWIPLLALLIVCRRGMRARR